MRIGNQIPGHFCSNDQNETALSEYITASGLPGKGGALAWTDQICPKPLHFVYDSAVIKIHARDSKQPVRAREWLFKSSWYTKTAIPSVLRLSSCVPKPVGLWGPNSPDVID